MYFASFRSINLPLAITSFTSSAFVATRLLKSLSVCVDLDTANLKKLICEYEIYANMKGLLFSLCVCVCTVYLCDYVPQRILGRLHLTQQWSTPHDSCDGLADFEGKSPRLVSQLPTWHA